MLIDETEMEDFREACESRGYADDEFTLAIMDTSQPGAGIHAVTGTVTVRREATGAERSYSCGHGTAWVAAFETDLKSRVFD